jgi:hypothetical protein
MSPQGKVEWQYHHIHWTSYCFDRCGVNIINLAFLKAKNIDQREQIWCLGCHTCTLNVHGLGYCCNLFPSSMIIVLIEHSVKG